MKHIPVFFVLALVVIVFSCSQQEEPSEVVKDFLTKVSNNDTLAIRHLAPEIRNSLGESKLKKVIQKSYDDIKTKGGIKSIDTVEEIIKENYAELTVEIVYGNGTSKTDKVRLVQNENSWQIAISK